MNPQATAFIAQAKKWRAEMEKLRALVLQLPLTEEIKWGKPCYSLNGKNVVLIIPFKNHVIYLLTKGALLKDPKKILYQPSENTQSARQIRFTSLRQILDLETSLKSYLREAVAIEKAGKEVVFKKITQFPVPAELEKKFKARPDVKKAFTALTPGRQRAYLLHFSGARQSATREARIEKCIPQILRGQGHNEQYRPKSSTKK